jgi:tagatose-1,6-bisphosphate aldolase non-catalytic subunit AgaZ/GatZ
MLFAATLNQVDYESSYTGWTPDDFVQQMSGYAAKYHWNGPLYPCLDHGGPWLKDLHTLEKLSYAETMAKVKRSITACIQAGYKLLHVDPTVDRSLPVHEALLIETVVNRTVELIAHAEYVRAEIGSARLSYEVGTEEVHGGLVDFGRFGTFVDLLRDQLKRQGLEHCWPCLFVAQIGTDLHTTQFYPVAARRLNSILMPHGSMIKGHYTDWVENPAEYPASGIGAANVGPEFTAQEYSALRELELIEHNNLQRNPAQASNFIKVLQKVVIDSNRWKKWLQPEEMGLEFTELPKERREWLIMTGSRYIWSDERVVESRDRLYQNLASQIVNPHDYVVEKITLVIEKYINAFNLSGSSLLLG